MKNTFEAFSTLATEYNQASSNLTDAKETKTSVSNELAHTALAIALLGCKDDKEALKESIAKDKPFHSLRGMVSKANAVAFYLLTHDAIELKDKSIVTLEAIKEVPDDAIPSVTVNELYKVISEVNKGDVEALNKAKAIEKQAIAQASEFLGQDISKKQFSLLPSEKQQAFIAEATVIIEAAEAQAAKAKQVETRAETITRLVSEIEAMGAQSEVVAALTAIAKVA